MKLTRAMLDEAANQGLLEAGQAGRLWQFLQEREQHTPGFKPAHILYYLGGLIAIGAMSLFMTIGWDRFGGGGLLLISLCYIVAAIGGVELLLARRLVLPAGVLAALAVVLVPLAVYGLQHLLGYWGDKPGQTYRDYHYHIDWRWLLMELATLAAGATALWRYRLPFTVMPVAITLWYMSMDIIPVLFGMNQYHFFSQEAKVISTVFGLGMTLLAFWVDLRTRSNNDFAFWLYMTGVITFWGGLTSMDSNSELGKLVYCLLNLLMIGVGAALSRRVFAVFGGLGVAIYLGHLSHTIFRDSLLFPLALTAIGLGVVAAGVFWQRREAAIGANLRGLLPEGLRLLVERRAGA